MVVQQIYMLSEQFSYSLGAAQPLQQLTTATDPMLPPFLMVHILYE